MPDRPAAVVPSAAVPTLVAFIVAIAGPALLAFNYSPSATLLNQLLAVAGWGLVLLVLPQRASLPRSGGGAWLLQAVFLLLALAVMVSWSMGLPPSLAMPPLALLVAAAFVVRAAQHAVEGPSGRAIELFFAGVLVAGVVSALIGMVQIFTPGLADGTVIARTGLAGRAVGNLRQPNHLSSLLMWALIALVPLAQAGRVAGLRLPRGVAAGLGVLLLLGVVLTASRTGLVGITLVALWGALDKRLAGRVRLAMLGAPLVYGLLWLLLAAWAHSTAHTFGGEMRLTEGDLSASRFGIWANTLSLIRANPLTGVGYGQFNFAWTLSEFPNRPVAFFDHTHNLPLQFAVELGLPLAALVMGLLCWALWVAGRRSWQGRGDTGAASRAAFMMVLLIGLHSLLEYPLWYAYFLLPAAWAWGWALRAPLPASASAWPAPSGRAVGTAASAEGRWPARAAGALLLGGACFAAYDYSTVVVIFSPGKSGAPLAERILRGQDSWFFSHHADYAAATTTEPPSRAMASFGSTTHALLDTRLMIDWATALAESGHIEQARYLAARLREFRNPAAATFFAACDKPAAAGSSLPFQCVPPAVPMSWRDFVH